MRSRNRIGFLSGALLAAALTALAAGQSTQSIKLGKTIQGDLTEGQTLSYSIKLKANQYLRAVVTQPVARVVIALDAPDGKNVLEVDSGDFPGKPARVVWIAETAGKYRIRVTGAGQYAVTLEKLRPAGADDRKGVEAERVFAQGFGEARRFAYNEAIQSFTRALSLYQEVRDREREADVIDSTSTAYSNLRQNEKAIGYSEQALAIEREIKDRRGEGNTLNRLGNCYLNLSQNEKAIGYYEQALAIRREIKDRRGEGNSLHNLGLAYSNLRQYEKAIGYNEQALAIRREIKDRPGEGNSLHNLGNAYSNLSQYEKAIGYNEQALAIRREIKDRPGEGNNLLNLGLAYYKLGQYEKAIGHNEQALAIRREINDRPGEGNNLLNLGLAYYKLGQYEKAISYNEQALAIRREIKDRPGEGDSLQTLGLAYDNLNQNEKAIGYYEQALAIRREIKDRPGEGNSFNSLGNAYLNLSQYEKAIGSNEQALAISREVKDRLLEGGSLTNLGLAYAYLSQYEKAIGYYEQALAIEREVKDRRGERLTLNNLGRAYFILGQHEKGIGYYEQRLAIERELKDRKGECNGLTALGGVYLGWNQYEKAIGYYEQALAIRRETKDRSGEGDSLTDLGRAYLVATLATLPEGATSDSLTDLGRAHFMSQYEKTIGYYEQALAIRREMTDRPGEGKTLDNLGSAYWRSAQYEKAISYYEHALAIEREVKDRHGEGNTLNSLGAAYHGLSQYETAISYYEQALAIKREMKDRRGEVNSLNRLGSAYSPFLYEKAIGYYEQGLAISREVKDRSGEASSLVSLMERQASDQPRLAIFYGKQAVNTIQSMRSDISGLDQDLQQSFLKQYEKPYNRLAEILIAQGRLAEAEQVLALLKEEEYFQYIRRSADEASSLDRRADLTPEEADYEKRYREIGDRLMTVGTERGELLAKKALTPEQSQRLAQLEQELAVGNQAFEHFLSDLTQHFSAKPEMTGRIETLRETQGIMEDLRELPAGTVAISTLIGDDKFHAILRTPDAQKAYEYPIKGADLNAKISALRQAIQDPKLDPRPLAEELYKILIAGMADDLRQANAKTLMWSLDGALRYVPLAALYDGKQYLIEQYRVSVMTLASNARLKDRPDQHWTAAGFGSTATLPSVASELAGIITTKPGDGGVLTGEIELDGQFTQQAMRQMLLKRYPVVHIASHFAFQPGNDSNSFLLLGDGGHLSLAELKTSANMFGGVQLLTLSACNTGVGDGAEVEGFGTLAQRQGAKAVIASLWPVADESTSLLMREFYRIRENNPALTKLDALREAQLELLRGMTTGSTGSPQRGVVVHDPARPLATQGSRAPRKQINDFSHPYFWAPFFLMGNWL